ncbi:MAG: hypothetical protein ACLFR1_12810, partial [Spirochaetia bacterium]
IIFAFVYPLLCDSFSRSVLLSSKAGRVHAAPALLIIPAVCIVHLCYSGKSGIIFVEKIKNGKPFARGADFAATRKLRIPGEGGILHCICHANTLIQKQISAEFTITVSAGAANAEK